MKKFVLRGGEVLSSEGSEVRDVFVEDGKIVEDDGSGDFEVMDCSGKTVMPGVIDIHVHFREPGQSYKEDWASASRAAGLRGVTMVCDMPNNQPPVVTLADLEAKREMIGDRTVINYGLYMGYDGKNFDDIAGLPELDKRWREEGRGFVPGVKVYCCHSTGDMGVSDEFLEEIFVKADKRVKLYFHSEDGPCIAARRREILEKYVGQEVPPEVHSEIRTKDCAVKMTRRLCEYARKYERPIHICHVTTEAELELVEAHRDVGVTCEVAPHHLTFSTDDYAHFGNFIKCNPPIRDREEVFALWKSVKMGMVDIFATDHAPHSLEEKQQGIGEAPSGVPSIEMSLPILLNTVNNDGLTMQELVKMCCERPAELVNFHGSKGRLDVGFDADIVVVDMEEERKFEKKDVLAKCGWSPFVGSVYQGWPVKTFVGGKLVE